MPRDARIGSRATAVLAEEPVQIRRAILCVAAKVVDAGPIEITEKQCAALPVISVISVIAVVAAMVIAAATALCHRIERVELRACRWDDAANSVRLASLFLS